MSEKDQNSFDDLLRSKVDGVKLAPSNDLFAKVEADYNRVHGRRKAAIWWSGGIAAVLALAALFIFLNPFATSSESSANADAPAEVQDAVVKEAPASTETFEATENPVIPEEAPSNNKLEETLSSGELNAVGDVAASESDAPAKPDAIEQNELTESTRAEEATNQGEDPVRGITEVIPPQNTPPTIGSVATAGSPEKPTLSSANGDEPDSDFQTELPPVVTEPIVTRTSQKSLNRMVSLAIDEAEPTRTLVVREPVDVVQSNPIPENFEVTCPKLIVGFTGGAGFSYRTLKSDVHHQLVDHKNSSEHGTVSTSAGVNMVYTFLGNSGIKTGLTYLRVGERYHFANDHAEHQTTNTYDYFNLDLKFNQTLLCRSKWRLDLAAGTKLNLLNNAQSSWLDPNSFEATAHDNEGDGSPFREYNLVWSADMTGYYFIGQRLFLGMTIEADRFQNSVYKNEVGLDQRPYSFQGYLNFGVRF